MKTNGYSGEASLARRRVERASARRRRAAALLALALAGALALGGTVAWLTAATPAVVNTFAPANVETEIDEDLDGGVKKAVKIANTGDVPVYVRAKVVVNWVKLGGDGSVVGVSSTVPVEGLDYTARASWGTAEGWISEADGFWYWTSPVAPGASTGNLIGELNQLEGADVPDGCSLSVEILSQAIQADGTTSDGTPAVADAWNSEKVTVTVNSDGELSVTTSTTA